MTAKTTKDLDDISKPIEYFWKVFDLEERPNEFDTIITKAEAGLRKIYKVKLSTRLALLTESEIFDLFEKMLVNRNVDEWFLKALRTRMSQILCKYLEKDYLSPEMMRMFSGFAYRFNNELIRKVKKFINKHSVKELNNSRRMTLERALEIYHHSLSNAHTQRLAKGYVNNFWRTQLRIYLAFGDIKEKEIKGILNNELSSPLTKKMAIRALAKLYPAN